jgi:RNA polymerase sporulation-specific sigma factor
MPLSASALSLVSIDDQTLAAAYQNEGDERALEVLISRYRRFARAKGRGYFLVGADHDDVEQEALIGLFKAVRDYRPDREASFRAFAELCITRQIITAIKTATRQKHQPLNQYLSYHSKHGTSQTDQPDRGLEDILVDPNEGDPCDDLVSTERLTSLRNSVRQCLSGLEVDVLRLYVEGKSYQEIGDQLGRHVKSIDNALQRIKRKLDRQIDLSGDLITATL